MMCNFQKSLHILHQASTDRILGAHKLIIALKCEMYKLGALFRTLGFFGMLIFEELESTSRIRLIQA